MDIEDGKENPLTKDVKETVEWLLEQYDEDEALKEIKRFLDKQSEIEGYPKLVFPMRRNSPYKQYLDNLQDMHDKEHHEFVKKEEDLELTFELQEKDVNVKVRCF